MIWKTENGDGSQAILTFNIGFTTYCMALHELPDLFPIGQIRMNYVNTSSFSSFFWWGGSGEGGLYDLGLVGSCLYHLEHVTSEIISKYCYQELQFLTKEN